MIESLVLTENGWLSDSDAAKTVLHAVHVKDGHYAWANKQFPGELLTGYLAGVSKHVSALIDSGINDPALFIRNDIPGSTSGLYRSISADEAVRLFAEDQPQYRADLLNN